MLGSGEKLGTAGAGVAKAMDGTDASVNPALIARLPNHFIVAAGVFHPERFMDTSRATAATPVGGLPIGNATRGRQWSAQENFPDGSAAVVFNREKWSFGLSLTGSGGMITDYPSSRINPAILQAVPGGSPTKYDSGIAYRIFNLHPAFAVLAFKDRVSFGISPIISYSDFKSDSATLTFAQTSGRNARDSVWGVGLRAGVDIKITDPLTFSIAGQTPTYYQRFKKYRDLLSSPMNFPANFTAGIAWDIRKGSTLLLDYQYVHFKGTRALDLTPERGGFGWDSMNIFKIGFIQDLGEQFTVCLGYNYGKSPIANDKVFANVIAPAITEHHFAAGLTYKPIKNHQFSISGYYAPLKKMTESGTGDLFSRLGKNTEIGLRIWDVQISYKYLF